MIDYLLFSLLACSRGAASLDYDTVAELRACQAVFNEAGDSQSSVVIPPFCNQLERKNQIILSVGVLLLCYDHQKAASSPLACILEGIERIWERVINGASSK